LAKQETEDHRFLPALSRKTNAPAYRRSPSR